MEDRSILVIVADDDRPLVQRLVDALADAGGAAFDDPRAARAAVLVAPPRAAASPSVDQLLTAWMQDHQAGSVLIVVVGGELHWDIATNSFDAAASTALSTLAQRLFTTRPLWLDAQGGVSAHLTARLLAALGPEGQAECPACGQMTTPDDMFCPACGAALAVITPSAASRVEPATVLTPAAVAPAPFSGGDALLVTAAVLTGVAGLVAVLVMNCVRWVRTSARHYARGPTARRTVIRGISLALPADRSRPWLALGVIVGWLRRRPRRARSSRSTAEPAAAVRRRPDVRPSSSATTSTPSTNSLYASRQTCGPMQTCGWRPRASHRASPGWPRSNGA